MYSYLKQCAVAFFGLVILGGVIFGVAPAIVSALNITTYSDRLSDSGPEEFSNHTLTFTLNTDLSPGSVFEVTPPPGFTIVATSTFAERNVQLFINGNPRNASAVGGPAVDLVEITYGSPGLIRYTLAPSSGVSSGSSVELRIGNHTTTALQPVTTFSTSTGTTTTAADTEPILNSSTLGVHEVELKIYDGGLVASEEFVIFLNEKVRLPNLDTTELVPPLRFDGSPTSTVGGTTLNVEISLETDELAVCKYSLTPDIDFGSQPTQFSNTGFLFHTTIVAVTQGALNQFYVRCIDDEGNFNIDDFVIEFVVNDAPTGTSNTDGSTSGDGSGSGNSGTGSGSGGGGTTGSSDGEQPLEGGSSGNGGSGGGGGGGSGGSSGGTAGGGFESTDAPFRSGDGRVIISGNAYPNSTVGINVDGTFFNTTRANAQGVYSITVDQIARGVYTFGVYAEDSNRVRSTTFSTSFTVSGARTSALGNINIAPTIKVTPNPVDPGQLLTVTGYALPNSTVTVQNSRLKNTAATEFTTTAGTSGQWSLTIDTTGFSVDTYQIRAQSVQEGGAKTNYSDYTFYGVGQAAETPINADLNRDGRVNLIDFSILLFWWNTDGGDSNPPADINRDRNVSLTDFSILLFNWTG